MNMLSKTLAVALASLALIAAFSGEETYNSPTFNGTPVDYCLRHGDMSSCGRESANAFCVAQGKAGVTSYKGYVVVPAAVTMSGQSCSGQCWAFESIVCGAPGPSAAASAGARVEAPSNSAARAGSEVGQPSTPVDRARSVASPSFGGPEYQSPLSDVQTDQEKAKIAERERQAELIERMKLAKRLMLRGYVLRPDANIVQQLQNQIFGASGPFRALFRMTSSSTEALDMLATGVWHGRRVGDAERVGLPKDYLGTCDEKTTLIRPRSQSMQQLGVAGGSSGGIAPPPQIAFPPGTDDYAMGCMGWVHQNQAPDTVPLYRYSDTRNGAYFYTISVQEGDNAERILGFKREGVCCFVAPGPAADTKPVYRVMCSETGHFYTPQAFVKDWMVLKEGCSDEGIAFHIWTVPGQDLSAEFDQLKRLEEQQEDRIERN
jgi:hypothetical protein